MSDEEKPKKGKGKGKDAKDKKGAKGKGKDADGSVSLSNHPRAGASIMALKAWGGMIGFGFAAFLSLRAGVPVGQAGMRAIIAGFTGYVVAWACGVGAWRVIVTAEARAQLERRARAASATSAPKAKS